MYNAYPGLFKIINAVCVISFSGTYHFCWIINHLYINIIIAVSFINYIISSDYVFRGNNKRKSEILKRVYFKTILKLTFSIKVVKTIQIFNCI